MKDETRQHLAQLIAEELSEKIRKDESLRRRLEMFADLPVEKVADAMLKQFEYLLSSELRDLIVHLIEQDVALDETRSMAPPAIVITADETAPESPPVEEPLPGEPESSREEIEELPPLEPPAEEEVAAEEESPPPPEPAGEAPSISIEEEERLAEEGESIMEHFGAKEPFPTEPVEIEFRPEDWWYIYGFCYAPDSTGKGIPSKRLRLKGIDKECDIVLVDYGDIRLFASQLRRERFSTDKSGKPAPPSSRSSDIKLEHERILNALRSVEVIVPMPFWSLIQGHDTLVGTVERRYVEMLRTLIDVHDATEWEVEVLAFDEHIMKLPSMNLTVQSRPATRQSRHQGGKDASETRNLEKVMIRERSLAQEVHNELLLLASKQKIDYMIRLDSAIMGDWKSIFSARYTVGKDKRHTFCQAVNALQKKFEEYRLMLKVTNPLTRFTFDA